MSLPSATQTVIESAHVLLIDDDDFVTVTLPHYLAKRGCNVVTARDRRSAETLLSTFTYDLVIFDPYMTGGKPSKVSIRPLNTPASKYSHS